jgi:hypothetical protein
MLWWLKENAEAEADAQGSSSEGSHTDSFEESSLETSIKP